MRCALDSVVLDKEVSQASAPVGGVWWSPRGSCLQRGSAVSTPDLRAICQPYLELPSTSVCKGGVCMSSTAAGRLCQLCPVSFLSPQYLASSVPLPVCGPPWDRGSPEMRGSERMWFWLFTNLEGLMEYRNEHPLGQAPKAEGEGCQFACVCMQLLGALCHLWRTATGPKGKGGVEQNWFWQRIRHPSVTCLNLLLESLCH